jgi:CHASE2 domain-containing sensor protein
MLRHTRLFHLYQMALEYLGAKKTRVFLIVLSLGWAIFSLFAFSTTWLDAWIWDVWQKIMMHLRQPSGHVLVVGIDAETLDGIKERWPWSRATLARLIDAIGKGNPKAILIDILLQHEDSKGGPAGDEELEKVIRRTGCVALIGVAEETISPLGKQVRLYRSETRFRKAAAIEGFIWGFMDPDNRIRSVVFRDDRFDIEGCLLQISRRIDPTRPEPPRLMTNPERFHIAYAQKDAGIPVVSAIDILKGGLEPRIFQNKIVIIGLTAVILHDYHQTSLGMISGPDILAAAMDTLLTGRTSQKLDTLGMRFVVGFIGWLLGLLMMEWYFPHRRLWPFCLPFILTVAGLSLGDLLKCQVSWGVFLLSLGFAAVLLWVLEYFLQFVQMQVIKGEAQAARDIQHVLFPHKAWISDAGYVCQGLCIPCEEVGGDYFDFFPQNDGSFLFVIADVTGHGTPAAMVTTMAKSVVMLLEKWEILTPANLLLTLNSLIYSLLRRKKLVSVMVGQLNPTTGIISLAAAGAPPAFLVKKDGTLHEYGIPGRPAGTSDKYSVKSLEFTLAPGDHLLLFTDGIYEAVDWNDVQYGFPRWLEYVKTSLLTVQTKADLEGIGRAVARDIGNKGFGDDVTLLHLWRPDQPAHLDNAKSELARSETGP